MVKDSKMRRYFRFGCTGFAAAALALVPATMASAAPTKVTGYSTDLNGKSTSSITWYGQTHANVVWNIADVKADGKPPIIFIYSTTTVAPLVFHLEDSDRNTSGNGTSDTSTSDVVTKSPTLLNSIIIKTCNGGSVSAPQNCDTIEKKNPYTH